MPRTRRPSLVAVPVLALAMAALVPIAFAQQPRGKHAKPKAPAVVDAGNPFEESQPASTPPASGDPTTLVSDAGPVAAPIAPPASLDGGVKPSPLNPAPNELPPQTPPALPDYDKLIGEVSSLRARVAVVTDTLFRSRIAVAVETDGNHAKTSRLVVSLDDGVVFTAQPGASFESSTPIYDHGVAPGRHAVTVEIDRKDDRDETFRTSQRSRFLVDVPKDERLAVTIRVDDDSNMGGDFPTDKSGRYDLRVRAKVQAQPAK